jgi:hypothetical protein
MNRKGAVLTKDQAVEIYKVKLDLNHGYGDRMDAMKSRNRSVPVARHYNVSPKTVRDIWNHVSWKHATYPIWSDADKELLAIMIEEKINRADLGPTV